MTHNRTTENSMHCKPEFKKDLSLVTIEQIEMYKDMLRSLSRTQQQKSLLRSELEVMTRKYFKQLEWRS